MDLDFRNLKTVNQVEELSGGTLSRGKLRAYIYDRKRNGFDHCLIRVGGRWLIDTEQLNEWLGAAV